MMAPGEAQIVADALVEIFRHPGHYENPPIPQGTLAEVAGTWDVEVKFIRGTGHQRFTLQQSGDVLTGSQTGEVYQASLQGSVKADQVELRSEMSVPGNTIPWSFTGSAKGDSMTGNVSMGEYGAQLQQSGAEPRVGIPCTKQNWKIARVLLSRSLS